MTIKVGDTIPEATLREDDRQRPRAGRQASSYFKGRRVALFSVPGAFTPTCSAKHLPGFVEKADELKAKGIDEIAGTAVNDAFVMGAWGKSAGVGDKVTLLADGNGDFAERDRAGDGRHASSAWASAASASRWSSTTASSSS